MDRKIDKNERQEDSSVYKGSEASAQQTTDSAYGSLGNSTTTSHYNRSISSKSPGSNLSKSSASGLSGFECFNQGPPGDVTKNVMQVVVSVSLPVTSKGVESTNSTQAVIGQPPNNFKKSHKKSKKNLERSRGGKNSAGKSETSGVSSNAGNSVPTDTSKGNVSEQGNQNHPSSSTYEDKAAKVAALSQALNYIDKFRRNQEGKDCNSKGPGEEEINDLATTLQEASQSSHKTSFPFVGSHDAREQITEVLDKEQAVSAGSGFCAAVSLRDGMVMCTTNSLTTVLGYPKDMWNGRSFIDFVHPKDRLTFTNKITSGIVLPFGDQLRGKFDEDPGLARLGRRSNTFFCRLRLYNGLRQGRYSVRTRKTKYNPFKLIVCFKDFDRLGPDDVYGKSHRSLTSAGCAHYGGTHSVYVIITAIPLKSAYSRKDEKGPFHETFVTRHLANCNFSMVDETAIPFIGYLPQDLEGVDIFSCYHTLDLPYLKEVYESVMAEQGKPFRSQPYRFKVRNGCYVLLETDWSCFINPWSKKLEFVIGKHTVLQGPSKPDIFDLNQEEEDVKEEMTTQCTKIQGEIKMILTESVSRGLSSGSCITGHNSSKRRKELASFMGSLLEEMAKVEATKAGISSENTSVIGNISHHNDYLSSESPPSYNQLNYNENLTRFFNSQPRTLTEKEAIESSFKEIDDSKIFGPNFLGESRNSRTTTNSESGNCSSQVPASASKELAMIIEEKSTKIKSAEQDNIECDSGENGTSGGVSANDPHSHKRLRNIHGGSGDGSGSGDLSGGSRGGGSGNGSGTSPSKGRLMGNSSLSESYRPAILTEELLLVHNRGMEKKMIESYTEGRKGEFRFLKSKFRNVRQSNHAQGQKRLPSAAQNQFQQFNENWRDKNNQRSSKHCRINEQVQVSTANGVTLWPPFSVTTTKPEDSILTSSLTRQQPHGLVQHMVPQVVAPMVVTSQRQSLQHDISYEANLYRNLIPAYYIPAATTTTTQSSRGGFLVHAGPSGQTFLQHPMTYVAPSLTRMAPHPVYYPINPQVTQISNPVGNRDPIISTESHQMVQPNPGLTNQVSNHQNCLNAGHHHGQQGLSERAAELAKQKAQRTGQNVSKFPNPSSRNAFSPNSRATSVKAEPGSALESNIESIASASVKDKIMSPVFHNNLRLPKEHLSVSDCTSSESSMFSLMKSSDDFLASDNSISSLSYNNLIRGIIIEKSILQDPFWLKSLDVTPHLMYEYQINNNLNLKDILKSDENRLRSMYQPPMVMEQLDSLYKNLNEKGEKARPLLDEELFPSGMSTMTSSESSSSSAESSNINKRIKKWTTAEKFSIFYEADAPLPPPDPSKNRKSIKFQSSSCSKKQNDRSCDDESSQKTHSSSSKDCGAASSTTTTATSSAQLPSDENSSVALLSQSRTSTSLGSSSAITIDSKKSSQSSQDGNKAAMGSTDEGICSKESASLENDNTTDSKSEDSGRQVQSKVLTDQRKKRK